MKTLIIRSSPLTSIGFVTSQVLSFFKINKVDLLTRNENIANMLKIKDINKIIEYNESIFKGIKVRNLQKYNYNNIVVPINGNLYSYMNVIKFCTHNFPDAKIFYCDYNKNIIRKVIMYPFQISDFFCKFFAVILFPLVILVLIICQVYLVPQNILKKKDHL